MDGSRNDIDKTGIHSRSLAAKGPPVPPARRRGEIRRAESLK